MYVVKAIHNTEEQILGSGDWKACIKLFNEIKNDDTTPYTKIGIYDETGELVWD